MNENPLIERLELIAPDGSITALDEDVVADVRAGESYTVRAVFRAARPSPIVADGICRSGETTSDAFPELSFCPEAMAVPRDDRGGVATFQSNLAVED